MKQKTGEKEEKPDLQKQQEDELAKEYDMLQDEINQEYSDVVIDPEPELGNDLEKQATSSQLEHDSEHQVNEEQADREQKELDEHVQNEERETTEVNEVEVKEGQLEQPDKELSEEYDKPQEELNQKDSDDLIDLEFEPENEINTLKEDSLTEQSREKQDKEDTLNPLLEGEEEEKTMQSIQNNQHTHQGEGLTEEYANIQNDLDQEYSDMEIVPTKEEWKRDSSENIIPVASAVIVNHQQAERESEIDQKKSMERIPLTQERPEETKVFPICQRELLECKQNEQKRNGINNYEGLNRQADLLIDRLANELDLEKNDLTKDFQGFKEAWNNYVTSGEKITPVMQDKFNEIQQIYGQPFAGIQRANHEGVTLLYRDQFVIDLEKFTDSGSNYQRFYDLYERYLETTNRITLPPKRRGIAREKGLNQLMIPVDSLLQEDHSEKLYVKNSRASRFKIGYSQFNPWGYNYRIFLPKKGSTAYDLVNKLMEEVPIEKKALSKINEQLRDVFPDSQGNYGAPTKVYRFKHSLGKIDEALSYNLYRSIEGKRLSRCAEIANRIIEYHEATGMNIIRTVSSFRIISENISFDIYTLNKSNALKDIIDEIKRDTKEQGYYKEIPLDKIDINDKLFWKIARKTISFNKIADIFQKAELDNIYSLNYSFSTEQISRFGLNQINYEIDYFWQENLNEGFTRVMAEMLGNPDVRRNISDQTELKLIERVIPVEVGHSHQINTVTKPDLMLYEDRLNGKKGGAVNSVQIKKMSKLGQYRGELNTLDYMVDVLKTFSYSKVNNKTTNLRRLQIYAIALEDNCNNLTDIASKNNVVIIGYWGNGCTRANRINDLFSALRLENYTKEGKCLNKKIEELVPQIQKRLSEGSQILNGTRMDPVSYEQIHEFVQKTGTRKTIYKMVHDVLFSILETYHEDFISPNEE